MNKKPFITADISSNHQGIPDIAIEMIEKTSETCHADAVRFSRCAVSNFLTPEEFKSVYPHPQHGFAATLGEHLEYLEFSIDIHKKLKEKCEECGLEYRVSVFDRNAAEEITSINPASLFIPDVSNLDFDMIEWICKNFPGEIHVSLGMTTKKEEQQIIDLFSKNKRLGDLIIYFSTSEHSVPFEQIALKEIERLKDTYAFHIKGIGFSGCHYGFAVDIAALTLGAEFFDRTFTLDRTWKGENQASALGIEGFRRLVRDLKHVACALNTRTWDIRDCEQEQRKERKRFTPNE